MDTTFETGNALFALGDYAAAETAFSQCLATDPNDWQAAANRGNARMKTGQHDLALEDYMLALALNPDATGTRTNLAVLLKELGEFDLAAELLGEVLAREPDNADALGNLGLIRHYQLRYFDAIDCHLKALETGGPSTARLNNLANAFTCDLQLDNAVMAYRMALQLEPGNATSRFNLAIALFQQGQYRDAWPLYEARWECMLTPRHTERRWQGDALGDRTLLIWSEQGLGDNLQVVRFLPALRAAHPDATLVFACPDSFHRLFAQLEGITLASIRDSDPDFDLQLPLMSLPALFGAEPGHLDGGPYLQADDRLVQDMARQMGTHRLRVGLVRETGVWGVGAADHGRQNKSVPQDLFDTLLDTRPEQDIGFFSLQTGELPASWQGRVTALPIRDFADTAAIIANLDLVISVDTSVVHLAGAMGKPVWVLMRRESAPFFMSEGSTTPWYDSARIWRQGEPGNWAPVIEAVRRELERS